MQFERQRWNGVYPVVRYMIETMHDWLLYRGNA